MGGSQSGLAGERERAPRTSFALYVLLGPSIAVALALAAFSISRDGIGDRRIGDFPLLPTAAPLNLPGASAGPVATAPGATPDARASAQAPVISTQTAATSSPRITTNTPNPTARPDPSAAPPTAAPTILPTSTPALPTSTPAVPTLPPVVPPSIGLPSPPKLP